MERLKVLDFADEDINSAMPMSSEHWSAQLAINTDTSLTVPSGANRCILNASGIVFIAADTVAVIPASTSFVKQAGVLNNISVELEGITTLHFISPVTPYVSVSFYC